MAVRRVSAGAAPQLLLALSGCAGVALLARHLSLDEPTALDRRVRARAIQLPPSFARTLDPLFPIGLPGGYIPIALLTARMLHRRRRRGGPAIVTAACAGWMSHRAAKLAIRRVRPPKPGSRRRTDSYPSGHTTGITALALTTAHVLHREGLISSATAALIAAGGPALMGAYRVIADDHWMTDVFGGWMLGGAVGLTCNALLADSRAPVRRSERW